ncbi:MAG: hypothetical protein RLY58_1957 [Pseudomonadota bacterium]
MKQLHPTLMQQLQDDYLAAKELGSPVLACQFMLVPQDFEFGRLLIKSGPYPVVSNNDPAEVNYAGGLQASVAGIPKTKFEGSISVIETEDGHGQAFGEFVVGQGGCIPCDLYLGRPGNFSRVFELTDCKIRVEQGEWDSESRSQVLILNGQMDYMYFGQFASIGSNGTVLPGQKKSSGAQSLINRVQQVINVAQSGVNLASQAQRFGQALGGLLG